MKILIIEDFQSSAEYLSGILKEESYLSNIALNGKVALQLLEKSEYNLIILDTELPDMSGVEILRIIRKRWNSSELPVVIIGNFLNKEEIIQIIELGANDFISKPFDAFILSLKIRNLLHLQVVNNQLKDKVDALKASEKALSEKNSEITNFFEITIDLLCILEINGTFRRVNKAWEEFWGLPEDEVLQLNILDYIFPADIENTLNNINELSEGKQMSRFVNRIRSKNGDYRWIEWNSIPYESQLIYSAARDITERIETEQKLKEYTNELKQLNKDKDRFISILAHDLKSPFNALLGFTSLLERNVRKYSTDRIETQVKHIRAVTQQTYYLLDDLLSWARIQAGKFPFEPVNIQLSTFTEELISSLKPTATYKGIDLTYNISDVNTIFADSNMLKTILRNLISNSIKFTNKDGYIKLLIEKQERNILFSVHDNGVGIAEEIIPKLFDIMEIKSSKGTENESGTGFGLGLCKEFITKHGGHISVESHLNKGSCFMFTIPEVIS